MMTNKDITGEWFKHDSMTIPKGTRVTKQSALGDLPDNQWFIDDLSWVTPWPDGSKKSGFLHDATYYGIMVTDAEVEED